MNSTLTPPTPPREYSLLPFWFWNDDLDEGEILRQIKDFDDHGVYGFVLHPRVGLPKHLGFMSDELLRFMGIAIDEAKRRDMTVLLYDEGMYPSGSASGLVVESDPKLACRCLALGDPNAPLPEGHTLVADVKRANGERVRIVDRPVDSVIRGLHYIGGGGGGPAEETPPAGDILNPATTAAVLRIVYDGYFNAFGEHFGKTIRGIFTDEPNALGRCRERNVRPGTTDILQHVNRLLGEDFTPHLPALWFEDEPDAEHHRERYERAIRLRLEESWYAPLSEWCKAHEVDLCGHPAEGEEIGCQRFFGVPGQDLVWRWVAPDEKNAIEGPESTQGKASSSAALHLGRLRNSNEFCGAYGPETTFDEFQWLAKWCLVRGVNLLIPHAFYYSIRGPRRDERPPQVGPNAPWWDYFKPFADACRRLSWLNATSEHVCEVAILTSDRCPWWAAKQLFERQHDFNYLENRLLLDGTATATADAISVGPMRYRSLLVEDETLLAPAVREKLVPFEAAGHVAVGEADVLAAIERLGRPDLIFDGAHAGIRVRQLRRDGERLFLVFNETGEALNDAPLSSPHDGTFARIDAATGEASPLETPQLSLGHHELALVRLTP